MPGSTVPFHREAFIVKLDSFSVFRKSDKFIHSSAEMVLQCTLCHDCLGFLHASNKIHCYGVGGH